MSWAIGYDNLWGRDIGYGVPATCDYPGCGAAIDRGLSHVCGGEPHGGESGCGLFFCERHQPFPWLGCERCAAGERPFDPTPDTPEWTNHKATHPSWEEWRGRHAGEE